MSVAVKTVTSNAKRWAMITATQLRAARALLGIDQKALAGMAGVSVPTIQRMEASRGNVRGVIDTLTRIIAALDRAGIEFIAEGMPSTAGGRGVRLKAVAAGDGSAAGGHGADDGGA
jgi:transcriptional regulator with XRE-family HTH domain